MSFLNLGLGVCLQIMLLAMVLALSLGWIGWFVRSCERAANFGVSSGVID